MQAYLEQLNKNRTGFVVQKEAFSQNPIKSETLEKSIDSVLEAIEQEMKYIENRMELITHVTQKLSAKKLF
jgi:hypothetical protein